MEKLTLTRKEAAELLGISRGGCDAMGFGRKAKGLPYK